MINRKRRIELRKRPRIYLKKYREYISEDSISDFDKSIINRFKNPVKLSKTLKELNLIVNQIRNLCSEMSYNDFIIYVDPDNFLTVKYTPKINQLINILNESIDSSFDNREEIKQEIFTGGYTDPFLDIELDHSRLNQIDIMNGLPNFMKNLGLGKKLYKRLIVQFDYISSFNSNDPSLDSNMVWNSIVTDEEIFSFSQNENIISFWNKVEYKIILEKLKEFLVSDKLIIVDQDFLIKYGLEEKEFIDSFQSLGI